MSDFWDPVNVRYCGVCGKQLTAKQKVACGVEHQRVLHSGERNPGWKGDEVKPNGGRQRAQREARQMPALCERCEARPPKDRHHKDGNTANNEPSNIAFLCRRCHMEEDGRLAARKTPLVSGELVAETVRLYRSGLSIGAVGEIMGVAGTTVLGRLKMADEPRRSSWETRRLAV